MGWQPNIVALSCTVHNAGLPQEQRQQCAFSHALGMQSLPDVLQTASCKYLIKTQHTLINMCILGDDVHQQVTMSEMDWGHMQSQHSVYIFAGK